MDSFSLFCYGTAGWLALQALPLVASPTIIMTLLSPDIHQPSALESYFARSLGIAYTTFAILFLLLSGAFPFAQTDPLLDSKTAEAANIYATPTILITTFYHSAAAFYTYTRFNETREYAFVVAAIVSANLAAMGLWCLLFRNEKGRISSRTGADKRTSGWPFENVVADQKRTRKDR